MTPEERGAFVAQLIRHEGNRSRPYTDTVGKITIGVGRNLSDVGLSSAEVRFLLDNDIDACLTDCLTFPWFADLDAVRQRAVLDLRFNLGPKKLRTFKRTLAALARQDYATAAANLRQSRWYRQVKSRGPRVVGMIDTGHEPT